MQNIQLVFSLTITNGLLQLSACNLYR